MVPDLHRRASRWHAENGDVEGAVRHALLAGDAPAAAELVERAIPDFRRLRREHVIRRWVDDLPETVVANRPALAMGLVGGLPVGRKGNPDCDADWFGTDWMDTTRSVETLNFQRISWSQLLAEMAERMGWRRYPARLAAPLAHALLKRRSPYYRYPGRYADPWGAILTRLGDPRPGCPAGE